MATGFELIRDLHKDARGFRPSQEWMAVFNGLSDVAKQETWDGLVRELSETMAEDERLELEAVTSYNARIDGMVKDYGIDRGTAMRWDLDAFEVDIESAMQYHGSAVQEIEFYLWKNGISSFRFTTPLRDEILAALKDTMEA